MKPLYRDELEGKEEEFLEGPDVNLLSQWLLVPPFSVVMEADAFSLGSNWVEEVTC